LDFAERSGAGSAAIEQCRAHLDAAKQASRTQLDLDRYYRRLREVGYDPKVTGFDGEVGIHMSIVGFKTIVRLRSTKSKMRISISHCGRNTSEQHGKNGRQEQSPSG
jgi:hypothetical protein